MTNGQYTFDDLVHTPDDGQRYEVIDGSLVVTPMAGGEHQPLVGLLFEQIYKASSPDLVVLPGAQLHLGTDAPIPDLVVVRDQASLPAAFTAADVVLVVEVVGPGQRERDRVTKFALYQRAGVEFYLIADLDGMTMWQLQEGQYRQVATSTGLVLDVAVPFPMRLIQGRHFSSAPHPHPILPRPTGAVTPPRSPPAVVAAPHVADHSNTPPQ